MSGLPLQTPVVKPFSLRRRMLLTLVPVLAIALLFLAYALQRSFAEASETSLQAQMNLQLRLLLADTDVVDGSLVIPELTGVPQLNQPEANLFAYTMNAEGDVLWRSLSLRSQQTGVDLQSLALPRTVVSRARGEAYFDQQGRWYVAAMQVAFGLESIDASEPTVSARGDEATSGAITFVVLDNGVALAAQQQVFKATLWRWLLIAMMALTAVQLVVLFWSFQPLGKLVEEMDRVKGGEQPLFTNEYPSEIEPLTDNLNRFVEHERKQRERYKNNLADLAHSLKTPLAAMRASIETGSGDQNLLQQIDRMDQIVAHQLNRSKVYNAATLRSQRCDIAVVVGKLLPVLNKVYARRSIALENNLPGNLVAALAEDDAMELLGNVLDNAFKYCAQQLRISGCLLVAGEQARCEIIIEDDGPGIELALFERVLARGARLDERQRGQGIGLAVASDIVEAYAGRIEMGRSALGGARLLISLPA